MKYVIVAQHIEGVSYRLHPIIFSDHLVHAMMADDLMRTVRRHQRGAKVHVYSAGTFSFNTVTARRGSESLKIKPVQQNDEDDLRAILHADRPHFCTIELF